MVVSQIARGCTSASPTSDPAVGETRSTVSTSEQPDQVSVPSDIDSDVASKLISLAADDPRIAAIATNADAYAIDGSIVQYKLLNLAIDDPQAIDFVYGFPQNYPQSNASPSTEQVATGTVPHLYQWDVRWGYTVYSNTAFAVTGCCPTALSMVYMGLTGDGSISPADMANLAAKDGYETDYNGTSTGFLTGEASQLGLSCDQISVDSGSLVSSLQSGHIIICNVGPGDFTTGGHFIVITHLNSDSTLSINDPYSSVRSAKTWTIDTVIDQTKALYAYSA